MINLIYVTHNGDCYEIALRGYMLIRITRYPDGSARREELDWDHLGKDVKELIVDKIKKSVQFDA